MNNIIHNNYHNSYNRYNGCISSMNSDEFDRLSRSLGLGDIRGDGFDTHGFLKRSVFESVIICETCDVKMQVEELRLVCMSCGLVNKTIGNESYINTDTPPPIHYKQRLEYSDSKFNGILNSVFNRLLGRRDKSGIYIPDSILRDSSMEYTRLHKEIRTIKNGPNDKKRYNSLIYAILQEELSKHANMSKPGRFICDFMGIEKKKLSKSKNELLLFSRSGLYKFTITQNNTESLIYQIIKWCDLDMKFYDPILDVVRTTNSVKNMINARMCEDKTKCVGSMWMIMNQVGIRVPHSHFEKGSVIEVSKSTYMRFVRFTHNNRKILNPILWKHNIRPIPRTFTTSASERSNNKLGLPPAKYKNVIIWNKEYA